MKQWYVVHTQPQAERKALQHLVRQGFGVYLPQYLRRRRHARRVDWVRQPLFPRYLFVTFDHAMTRWRSINSTTGVSHLVCHGNTPAPMPEGVVEDIRAREDADGIVPLGRRDDWSPGDPVRILEGPMYDQVGLFECHSDEERVILLMNLLGRQVRVRVPVGAIRAYA